MNIFRLFLEKNIASFVKIPLYTDQLCLCIDFSPSISTIVHLDRIQRSAYCTIDPSRGLQREAACKNVLTEITLKIIGEILHDFSPQGYKIASNLATRFRGYFYQSVLSIRKRAQDGYSDIDDLLYW